MKSAIAIIASAALAGFSLASPYQPIGKTDSVSNGAFYRNRVPETTEDVGGTAAPVVDPSNILGVDENNEPQPDCDEVLEDSKNLDSEKNKQKSESDSTRQQRQGKSRKKSDDLTNLVTEKPQQKSDSDSTRQGQQGDNRDVLGDSNNSVIGQPKNNSDSGRPRKGRKGKTTKEDAKKWWQEQQDQWKPKSKTQASNQVDKTWDGSDPEFRKTMLDEHNSQRSNHGTGELVWSDLLSEHALANVKQCEMKHDTNQWRKAGQPEGQNLLWSHVNNYCIGPIKEGKQSMDRWVEDEKEKYPGKGAVPNPIPDGAGYLHLTQVLWKGTFRVGCAYACCNPEFGPDGKTIVKPGGGYLACNYDPPGNVNGGDTFEENVNRDTKTGLNLHKNNKDSARNRLNNIYGRN